MEPSELPEYQLMAKSLCLEAIKSVPRNDLGDSLSLTSAAAVCCMKICNFDIESKDLWQHGDCLPRPESINKSLAGLSFILYQSLYYIEIEKYEDASFAIIEALELFGIAPQTLKPVMGQMLAEISDWCSEIVKEQKDEISKVLNNDK